MVNKKELEEQRAKEEKERYEFFKARQGKCQYCGTRLKWDAYEVRGLAGGWVLEEQEDGSSKAFCYKCFEFPQRGRTAHRLTIYEEQRSTEEAMGLGGEGEEPQAD
ncbi:MAG: hypothetical protein WC966_03915 [Bradymonadales bacterium]|jgi:hypothetical protein